MPEPTAQGNVRRTSMALAALLALLAPPGGVAVADFYISPRGSDDGPGTQAAPFATLEAAREAVRKEKSKQTGPVTVWIGAGDYLLRRSLEFTQQDSGSDQAPVVWRNQPGERVRLLGGRLLDSPGPLTDPAVRERLHEETRPQVVVYDLGAADESDLGTLSSRGFGRPTRPAHSELFFEGKPMTLARWPNEGQFASIAGFPDGTAKGDDHGGRIGDLTGGFLYEGDRPRGWAPSDDVWVHGYWAWDWANSYERVTRLDRERRLVETAPPHGQYGFRPGQRFYFLNVLEELDQPGEWYLERAAKKLYFWPPKAEGIGATPEVFLSTMPGPLIRMVEVSHLAIQGLVMEGTRGSGIEILGGRDNRVAGCTLRNLGNHGVVIAGGQGHGVVSCDIFDTGDGGVMVSGGDRTTLAAGEHFVDNCHFQRQGRWSKCYVPAIQLTGVGLRASHNWIHEHPHCAILFWGNDHLIEFNDIHHIALETGDVGAIYTGRDYTFRGNRIRHNYIHETGGVGMGSMGVYMDDCVSGTEVYGNVFYRVHWAMFVGGGRDHRIENNLFVDCDPAIRVDGRGLDPSPVWRGMVNETMRERLAAVPAALYRARYPELKTLDRYYGKPTDVEGIREDFRGVPPSGNVITRNVCQGKWLETGWHAREDDLVLQDNHVSGDAGLVKAPRGGFTLRSDSPAWATGFRELPVDDMGIRMDIYRREMELIKGGVQP